MSLLQNQSLLLACICLLSLSVPTFGRELLPSQPNTEARLINGLKGDAGLADCWNAMMELRSCTNEIVLFFLNGESYLSIPCCRAIRLITRKCWPSMLASIGFTAEEADILRGYCDASPGTGDAVPPPPSSSPPPSPSPPTPAPSGSEAMVVDEFVG